MRMKSTMHKDNDFPVMVHMTIILALHIALSLITVSAYGLSFMTVFCAPAMFIFYCALEQQMVILAIVGLITLYHVAPRKPIN